MLKTNDLYKWVDSMVHELHLKKAIKDYGHLQFTLKCIKK